MGKTILNHYIYIDGTTELDAVGSLSFFDGKVNYNLTLKNSSKTFFFPSLCLFLFLCIKFDLTHNKKSMLHQNITPFAVHNYEKICNHLRGSIDQ